MDRKGKRQKIDKALKNIIVPFLREKGFKGSMPHFRREQSDRINLLTFQHSLYDTKFVIEIANAQNKPFVTHWGKTIEPNKLTAHDLNKRKRIQAVMKQNEDSFPEDWFRYDKSFFSSDSIYKNVCKEVLSKLDIANEYWANGELSN